jgi:hypothetical protein
MHAEKNNDSSLKFYNAGDLGLSVKFCRVRGLRKLHGIMAKLTEGLARLGHDWRELATATEAQKAWRAVAQRSWGKFR